MDIVEADLIQYQNGDLYEPLQWVDRATGDALDWSAYTFEMDIKTTGSGSVVFAATIDDADSDEGTIVIEVPDGSVGVGSYVYDIVKIDGGSPAAREVIMTGAYIVRQGVTQP